MASSEPRRLAGVLETLAAKRLLLKQDPTLPSVVGIVTGERLRTSWWSHPRARLIFAVLSQLVDHPNVLVTKLLLRKDTFVHRALWPAVLAVGRAREPWQTRGLSREARRLLGRVDGDVLVHATGAPVRELEARLLVTTRETHAASGRHELVLESWRAWSRRVGCKAHGSVSRARAELEEAALDLGASVEALPWSESVIRRRMS
jgi:hypothetical protein